MIKRMHNGVPRHPEDEVSSRSEAGSNGGPMKGELQMDRRSHVTSSDWLQPPQQRFLHPSQPMPLKLWRSRGEP